MKNLMKKLNLPVNTLAIVLLLSMLTISISCLGSSTSSAGDTAVSLQTSVTPLVTAQQNAYKHWQQDYWAKQGSLLPGDIYAQKHSGASLKTKMSTTDVPGSGPTYIGR